LIFANSLSFAFYSRHQWDTTWFRDNWLIDVTRTLFCTKTTFKFPTFLKHCWALRSTKFWFLQILWVCIYNQMRYNKMFTIVWQINVGTLFCTKTTFQNFNSLKKTLLSAKIDKAKFWF
jgi:hypothetical protein